MEPYGVENVFQDIGAALDMAGSALAAHETAANIEYTQYLAMQSANMLADTIRSQNDINRRQQEYLARSNWR